MAGSRSRRRSRSAARQSGLLESSYAVCRRDASPVTKRVNQALLGELPFDYTKDFEAAPTRCRATVSHEMLSSKHKSSSLAGTAGLLHQASSSSPSPGTWAS
jgi:hypothetical protein